MAERLVPAIVLSVRNYGEADLLVTFLTPSRGLLTGMAKHAKKSRRRFAHCLEPLNRVDFFLSPPRGEGISGCTLFSILLGIFSSKPVEERKSLQYVSFSF